jgi:hypothetical protein
MTMTARTSSNLPAHLEGRRPIGRPRHRWEDNIKTGFREIGLRIWTGLTWLRIGTSGRLL